MGGRTVNDAVFQYLDRITSEIVKESGNSGDKYHLGKLVLKGLKDYPQAICQIDGATGESETNGSVLSRSTRMASCMRNFGLKRGDVIAHMAPNHMDVCVPFYAALYLGVIFSAVDRTLPLRDLKATFEVSKPKVIFCQSDKAPEIQLVLNQLNMDSLIVTFDGGIKFFSFKNFISKYGEDNFGEETFRVSEFDGVDTTALIIATSGTTGLPKAVAVTNKNFAVAAPYSWCKHTNFPTPTALVMICSPLQWLSALVDFVLGPIFTYTRLQTSTVVNKQHCCFLINKYRPTLAIFSPTLLSSLIKMPDRCDFTCFETIALGGSAVSVELINNLKEVTSAEVTDVYGMSELAGLGFMADDASPPGSCGKPLYSMQYRLIKVDNGEEIFDPYVPGELLLRGPGIFKEYYNNPEATADTFTDDGWFRTGDLFYRDFAHNYFYVERIKLMLKYKQERVFPIELENLIRSHPDVADVAVTSVADPDRGDLAVACVVRRTGSGLTAQEIKDIVRDNLFEMKHLHGGVVFLDEMPMTASTKIHRRMLKEMVLTLPRE